MTDLELIAWLRREQALCVELRAVAKERNNTEDVRYWSGKIGAYGDCLSILRRRNEDTNGR